MKLFSSCRLFSCIVEHKDISHEITNDEEDGMFSTFSIN
jgi:hypothetical protein